MFTYMENDMNREPENGSEFREQELIWGAEAANILGISRTKFNQSILHNKYPNIRYVQKKGGRKYVKIDVFRTAYPTASEEQLPEIIMKYNLMRDAQRKDRRKTEKGNIQAELPQRNDVISRQEEKVSVDKLLRKLEDMFRKQINDDIYDAIKTMINLQPELQQQIQQEDAQRQIAGTVSSFVNWLTEQTTSIFKELMGTPEWQALIQVQRDIVEQTRIKTNEKEENPPQEALLQDWKRASSIFMEQIQKNRAEKNKSEGKG